MMFLMDFAPKSRCLHAMTVYPDGQRRSHARYFESPVQRQAHSAIAA